MEKPEVAQFNKTVIVSKEQVLDSSAKQFTSVDILYLILSMKIEYKDIELSANNIKLLDLILIMNDCERFSELLQKLNNVNLIIPLNSPIWAGYNLLHLSVCLRKKTFQNTFLFDLPKAIDDIIKQYQCKAEENILYWKRIRRCLKYGCSVSIKNAKGQSPIHLAFILREAGIVEMLLNYCKHNVADENNLSHLHIACALGKIDVVERYLDQGANVNSQVRINFDWYEKYLWESKKMISVRVNSTPLHIAVAFGHMELVEYLLENNADVYAKDSLDLTPIHLVMSRTDILKDLAQLFFRKIPNLRESVSKVGLSHLHVACSTKNEDAVKRMIREGADVDRVIEANVKLTFLDDLAEKTPLLLAVSIKYPSETIIKALLEAGANVHVKDGRGMSVLNYSLEALDDQWTEPIVEMLKSVKCNVEASGMSMLHFACGNHDIDWAKKLLKNGADVNAIVNSKGFLQGATPLYLVVQSSLVYDIPDIAVDLVKLLLNSGANVIIPCRDECTPLNVMYEQLHTDVLLEEEFRMELFMLEIADLLLKAQKSYNVNPENNDGFSHFHFACIRNLVGIVKTFLDFGVDVNKSTDHFGRIFSGFTPLHFALTYRSKEVAYLLLERGADVNAEDSCGNKPLHAAIKKEFVDLPLIETMLSRGADINAENLNGESLLYCLLKSGGLTLERLEFFLDHGCSINIADIVAVDANGKLTVDNYLSAICFLMSIGYELDQQNAIGRTALHEAVLFYNLEAVYALLQLGADINVVDYENKCPFSNNIILMANASNESRKKNVVKVLVRHILKMKFAGLNVSDSNWKNLEKMKMPCISKLEQSYQYELTKAKQSKIDQFLTVNDFLSEFGAIAKYRRLCSKRRAIVDKFFRNTSKLRRDFPEFSGLLTLNYRKAFSRLKLLYPAKKAIVAICQTKLPDLCLENILGYFTDNELKRVSELVTQLIDYS